MTVPMDELLRYCKVDDDEEHRLLLTDLAEEAESYLRANAGTEADGMSQEQLNVYKGTVKMMVLEKLDDPRGEQSPPGLRNQINSVKTFTV